MARGRQDSSESLQRGNFSRRIDSVMKKISLLSRLHSPSRYTIYVKTFTWNETNRVFCEQSVLSFSNEFSRFVVAAQNDKGHNCCINIFRVSASPLRFCETQNRRIVRHSTLQKRISMNLAADLCSPQSQSVSSSLSTVTKEKERKQQQKILLHSFFLKLSRIILRVQI